MTVEGVDTLSCPHIPDAAVVVKGARDDEVSARVEAQRHDLSPVAQKGGPLLPTLHVPQLQGDTSAVSTRASR